LSALKIGEISAVRGRHTAEQRDEIASFSFNHLVGAG
jgi:hypothetical protein